MKQREGKTNEDREAIVIPDALEPNEIVNGSSWYIWEPPDIDGSV